MHNAFHKKQEHCTTIWTFASVSLLRLYQWWPSYFYTINPTFQSHPNTLFLLPVQEFSHLPECRFMNIHQRFLIDWSSCFQICQLLELWHNICDLRHRKRKAIKLYTASLSHNVLALTKEKNNVIYIIIYKKICLCVCVKGNLIEKETWKCP